MEEAVVVGYFVRFDCPMGSDSVRWHSYCLDCYDTVTQHSKHSKTRRITSSDTVNKPVRCTSCGNIVKRGSIKPQLSATGAKLLLQEAAQAIADKKTQPEKNCYGTWEECKAYEDQILAHIDSLVG